ncbi:hypothetical protein DPMN_010009 [Dreissena polymorpha]|uniref:Uncharacterized protein n=1 Tax=Dreissena polymorpha TaxID=45954 RepID=A0A9D4MY04_DREPO|nr:hypothetical protein DPMN_010009 [Dreissena polymorpha]
MDRARAPIVAPIWPHSAVVSGSNEDISGHSYYSSKIKKPVPRDFFGYVWDNRMSTDHRFRKRF